MPDSAVSYDRVPVGWAAATVNTFSVLFKQSIRDVHCLFCSVHATLDEHAAKLEGRVGPDVGDHDTAEASGTPAVDSESGPQDGTRTQESDIVPGDSRAADVQRKMSLSAADSMLLSAEILNSSSSIPTDSQVREGSEQSSKDAAQNTPAQVAINIALPNEIVVDQALQWHGRWPLLLYAFSCDL